ncbi:SDR family oxidoreductase [Alcanivorax sp. 1008]|uniref:SDR family oxidoreductase n=1 Tax=Alcanivorax sp. 1008 TaxID=2816853 RepID=UPI001E01B6CF|nr:SDR family oxidoreductase [Alcanivorax sp. 1008]MCC1495649.1 SDR family oxidoreductase [Alcanivorax sp. 1008]
MPAKTAFITGGTGFLGGHVIAQLKAANWRVVALHRPQSDPAALKQIGAEPVSGQLDDSSSLLAAMPEMPDAVFHIAGNTSMWSRNNEQQSLDNVTGTRNLVDACLRKNAGRFIHTSSISAWGVQSRKIDESTPSNAAGDWINYNRTKYEAEQQVRAGIAQGLDAVILNPCGIIGAGDRHNWSQMISLIDQGKLPGVPPGSGNFCDVREVAKAHLSAFDKGQLGANYILAGIEASFLELARTIAFLLDRKAPRRTVPKSVLRLAGHIYPLISLITGKEPDLTPEKVALITNRVAADGSRAVRELGFNDQVPLEEMLTQCISWMRAEGLLNSP